MPLVRKPGGAPPTSAPVDAGVVQALASPDEDTRWNAARAAAAMPECAGALGAALPGEKSPRVREAMFTSLARMATADSAAAAVSLLRSDDAGLRAGALDALRIMIGSSAALLPALLRDQDVDIRILSCELARVLPGAQATAMLCDLLQRESEANACAAAVDVLAEVGQPEALPVLAACATKFRDVPFLAFAIQLTVERISAESPAPRG